MSIPSIGAAQYQSANAPITPTTAPPAANAVGSTDTNQAVANAAATTGNSSSLSSAIAQALAQLNNGTDLSSLLTPGSQQSSSDFMNSLLAAMQGSSSSNSSSTSSLADLLGSSSSQAATPVSLNQSSSTYGLQTSIQNLITQLNGNSNSIGSMLGDNTDSSTPSGLADLQQSFNSLVTSAGGNPTQASLQSFLQTVSVTLQGNMVGSLFDTMA